MIGMDGCLILADFGLAWRPEEGVIILHHVLKRRSTVLQRYCLKSLTG